MTQRKMFKIKMMLLLAAALLIESTMHAQVTIGLDEAPAPGSLLQLKDKANVVDGTSNAYKGVGLPRVQLSEKNQLYPMFLNNPDDPTSGPDANYQTQKNQLDKMHIGLFVYNLTEDEDKDLYPGLYQWDGTEWKSFETKMGNAKFDEVDCSSDITVNGTYIEGAPVTAANYLTINLTVKKPGAYFFTITSGNGYSFYLSGVALTAGPMTINVPCQGTPVKVQTDMLTLSGMDMKSGCQPKVEVVSSVAEYSLGCSSISVNGDYIKGTLLDASNTITIHVTVGAVGSYSIEGSSNAGISFKGTGVFSSVGSHTVTLIGTGKPTVNTDIPITIRSNSPDDNTLCSAVAKIILPGMTYAIIGSGDYSWNNIRREALRTNAAFGSSGVVKMAFFSELWRETTASAAETRMRETVKPDIILYFSYGATPTTTLSTLLADYVKAGGVLIYGSIDNDPDGANHLLNGIFGTGAGTAAGPIGSDDNDYQINTLPNDPIINGPFGNLSGKHWGEDNVGSIYVRQLPPNSVQICAANNQATNKSIDPEYSMIWYNESMNFVYFGDSPAASTSSTASNGWPTIYTNGLPKSKPYGTYATGNGNPYVYNAVLEFNILAWGIKKAATSGINPH